MIYKVKGNRVMRTYRGGERLTAFTGESAPDRPGALYPEDWTASLTSSSSGEEGIGTTTDGQSLREIIGNDDYPLLVKLLDADERLVIQAHPTVPFARAHCGSEHGKTECWYFLDCAPDACVYLGFREGITREKWKALFLEQDTEGMLAALHRVPVKKGDFVFVDGGVPHAIGGGCFMIELQEPSDLMVAAERFTPSGRRIPDERMDMGLGLELSLSVYQYEPLSEAQLRKRWLPAPREVGPGVWEILGADLTDKFSMYRLENACSMPLTRKYAVAIVTDGSGELNGQAVRRGERLLIKDESALTLSGENLRVVVCQ